MVDGALDQIPIDARNRFAIGDWMPLHFGGCQRIQPRVRRGSDRLPHGQYFLEWGCTCRRAVGKSLFDVGEKNLSQPEAEEISLFLPCQVPDVPADAVHRKEAFAGVFVCDAFYPAHEFAAGEAELVDERVGHGEVPFA